MVLNQTSPISRLLVLEYVSSTPDLNVVSWIDTTLPAFSLATQQPTRISATLISLPVLSKFVIMPSSTRLGIFNWRNPQRHNFLWPWPGIWIWLCLSPWTSPSNPSRYHWTYFCPLAPSPTTTSWIKSFQEEPSAKPSCSPTTLHHRGTGPNHSLRGLSKDDG